MEFRNYLLSALAKTDLLALLPSLSEISLERGKVLLEPGDPIHHVIFPSTVVISVVTLMEDGAGVESATVGPESVVALLPALASQSSRSRMFVQIAGSAMRLPAAVLRQRAAESPPLMTLLLRHVAATNFQAEQSVACNALHDAPSRLARWLLMTQDRTGGQTLPLTQDYMAIMTGVQRTTISALANQLRNAGLIKFSRGNIEITDRAGLEAYACECYHLVRDEFDGLGFGRRLFR